MGEAREREWGMLGSVWGMLGSVWGMLGSVWGMLGSETLPLQQNYILLVVRAYCQLELSINSQPLTVNRQQTTVNKRV